MSIDSPKSLVEAFKDGEFDALQKELLANFQNDEAYSTFRADIADIVRQQLAKAPMLHYLPQDTVCRELTQEVERYPIVDRAVKEMRMFSDPAFQAKIRGMLKNTLQEDAEKIWHRENETSQAAHSTTDGVGSTAHNRIDDSNLPAEKSGSTSRVAEDAMDVDN